MGSLLRQTGQMGRTESCVLMQELQNRWPQEVVTCSFTLDFLKKNLLKY